MEDYNKICKDILELDPKVRYAGICDESGETKYGGFRDGLDKDFLSPEDTKKANIQGMARWGLRNALAPKIGKGKYAMAEYEKVKRITIPVKNYHLLLITTEVDANHGKIINDALKLLN